MSYSTAAVDMCLELQQCRVYINTVPADDIAIAIWTTWFGVRLHVCVSVGGSGRVCGRAGC